MRAYRLAADEHGHAFALREEADPAPGPTEILVRIRAASLNRRDLMILAGTYPLPARPGIVPLSDGAGEVVAVGGAVTRFRIGDRVTGAYFPRWRDGRLTPDRADQLGCTLDGMLADHAVLDEQWAVGVPDHLTWEEAACLTCAGVTAWNAVTGGEPPVAGQTVLTLGTGGVALFAIQFARLLGCRVIAVTSRAAKAGQLRALGAEHVIDRTDIPAWGAAVRDLTGGEGVDRVVETVGPATLEQSLIASARYGQIMLLITRGDGRPRIEIAGEAWARSLATIRRLFVGNRADLEAMNRAVAAHRLRPVIDRVFAFEEAHAAYAHAQRGDLFGKVVIRGG